MVARATLHPESKRPCSADKHRGNSTLLYSPASPKLCPPSLSEPDAHGIRRHLRNHLFHSHHLTNQLHRIHCLAVRYKNHLYLQLKKPEQRICTVNQQRYFGKAPTKDATSNRVPMARWHGSQQCEVLCSDCWIPKPGLPLLGYPVFPKYLFP